MLRLVMREGTKRECFCLAEGIDYPLTFRIDRPGSVYQRSDRGRFRQQLVREIADPLLFGFTPRQ